MRLFLNCLLAVLILQFLLVSCRPKALELESPAINEVKAGDKFRVNLPEDHTDGYTWQLNSDELNRAQIQELNAVWHGTKKGIDFNFKALAAGQQTLTFVKRKYIDTLSVKSFIVKIKED